MATLVQVWAGPDAVAPKIQEQARHLTTREKIDMMIKMAVDFAPMLRDRKLWTFVHLRAPQLVLSDNPLGVSDPNPRPLQGTGLFSTPTVEVTLPLTPSCCLTLHHEPRLPEHMEMGVNSRDFAEPTKWW